MIGRWWNITSGLVWALVERQLQCFVFCFFFVFLCVLCMSFHSHVVECVLLGALLIRSPAVLIAEQCQQSGHSVINGLRECMWTPVLYVSAYVFVRFTLLKVFWFCVFYYWTLRILCSLQTDLRRAQRLVSNNRIWITVLKAVFYYGLSNL